MQPLSALQRLTAVTFTRCEYGAGKQLSTTALAALTGLVALDASGCTPFKAAGARLFMLGVCGAMMAVAYRSLHWLQQSDQHSQHHTGRDL